MARMTGKTVKKTAQAKAKGIGILAKGAAQGVSDTAKFADKVRKVVTRKEEYSDWREDLPEAWKGIQLRVQEKGNRWSLI